MRIGDAEFELKNVAKTQEEDDWAGVSSYGKIYNALVEKIAQPLEYKIKLFFRTPTTFRQDHGNLPLPMPRLVFRNYWKTWNLYSPVYLGEELSDIIEKTLLLKRHDIKTRMVNFGGKHGEVGFIGVCEFAIHRRLDSVFVLMMNLLADFAFYCGTGAKTTMGMGQTKRIE